MNKEKMIITVIGAIMAIIGLGGAPIYAVQRDVVKFAIYTGLLVAGILILGHAAKD